jgi:hypothetical protein
MHENPPSTSFWCRVIGSTFHALGLSDVAPRSPRDAPPPLQTLDEVALSVLYIIS